MQVSEVQYGEQPPIDSYGAGGFRIAETFQEGSLVVSPSGVMNWGGELTPDGVAPLADLASQIDVLLVGMGAEIAPLPAPARAALEEAGIGVEIMSTPSACRTYNVLLAEDRRVAAALIAI